MVNGGGKLRIKNLFIATGFVFILGACTNEQSLEKVEVQEAVNFSESKSNTLQTITNESDIKIIKEVFEKAVKVDGIVNMAEPHYTIKFGDEMYFLWLDETNNATIMNAEDTHTIYTIRNAEKIMEIIN